MYLLYLDESVDQKDHLLTLGSVLLPASKYRKFNEDFNSFLYSNFKINEDIEIKGEYIWNGRNFFNHLSMDKRAAMSFQIAQYLEQTTLTNFIVTHGYFNDNANETYLLLLNKVIGKVAKIISKKSKSSRQLLFVFDERQDINKQIYELCAMQRRQIISRYKKSCVFIDNGYQGISKFSRLIQVADFVGYFIRNEKVTVKTDTLFRSKDNDKKIKLVENIKKLLSKKLIVIR